LFGDAELRNQASRVLAEADWRWLGGAVLAAATSEILCATRWWIVLHAFGMPLKWREAVAISAIGLFYSLGLPGSAGGDAMRTLYVMERFPDRKLAAAFSVLADRFCGMAALVLALGWTLVAHHGVLLQGELGGRIVLAAAVFLAGALAMLGLWWTTTIPALGDRIQAAMPKFGVRMRQSGEIFNRMLAHPRAMLLGAAISVVSLAAHFAGYFLSACAFETGLSAGTIFTVMPVVDTLTMIPVALYGLGLREALFAVLLGEFFGVAAGTATLVSLGGFAAQALVALSGVLFLPFARSPKFVRADR
jgi:uncharacterized protein (TIRG00374 family)